jgi:hypothetical protein
MAGLERIVAPREESEEKDEKEGTKMGQEGE